MPDVLSSPVPLMAVGVPLAVTLLTLAIGRKSEITRNGLVLSATILALVLPLSMLPGSLRGAIYNCYLMEMAPNIWMRFRVDQLGLLFALTASTLWLMAAIHSFGYMKGERNQLRYYSFMLLCLAWTLGVAFSGNLLTFFIFYELFSITTYPLIVHEQTPAAIAAGKKYIVYILIGGAFVLLGVTYTFYLAKSLSLARMGILSLEMGRQNLLVLFWVFVVGFGVKAAIMPLHGWVPDAHPAAPSPFSALLSGVMVAAGAFGILRVIFNVFGPPLIAKLGVGLPLAYVASVTIVVASVLALDQDNLKRRLAYSTIGQMSYIILGGALLTPYSTRGAMIHIVNHAFMKGTLFLCAGVLIKCSGKHRVSEMRGIAKDYPLTMAAFTVGALGMIGTPPLSGFISKWFLGLGALEANEPIFVVVLLLSALLGAAYFLPIVYVAWFERQGEVADEVAVVHNPDSDTAEQGRRPWYNEAPLSMLIPIGLGTLATVVLGFCATFTGSPFSLARCITGLLTK